MRHPSFLFAKKAVEGVEDFGGFFPYFKTFLECRAKYFGRCVKILDASALGGDCGSQF